MPRFYSKKLNRTLGDMVDECLDASPEEQLNLLQELAVMRSLAVDVCKIYDACPDDKKVTAGLLLRESMHDVVKVCEAASRVERLGKDKISVHNLAHVVSQIVQCAYKAFGDMPERAKEFEQLLRDTVKVADEASGTSVTPDMDVADMDDSVPREE